MRPSHLTTRPSHLTAIVGTLIATILLGPAVAQAAASPAVSTNELMELLRSDAQGETLGSPMFLRGGQALVNVRTGHISFDVKHLPVAAGPSDVEFGDPQVATMVKGTLVCNASAGADATLVHTPPVAVNDQGDVTYMGQVPMPAVCVTAPNDLAFFLRTVEGTPQE